MMICNTVIATPLNHVGQVSVEHDEAILPECQ
jgi:hypothetical protein